MSGPNLRSRLVARIAMLLAVASFVLISPPQIGPAEASAQWYRQEIDTKLNANYGGNGQPLSGVSGNLYVYGGPNPSISNTFSQILMYYGSGDTAQFIQCGSMVGKIDVISGTSCGSATTQTLVSPTLVFIWKLPTQSCEHVVVLGTFGAVNITRNFGVRRNSNGSYYATLDNVVKYTTPVTGFAEAMYPAAAGETLDTCGSVSLLANAASGGPSLARYDAAAGWQYWLDTASWNVAIQYPQPLNYYTWSHPNGHANTAYISGPTSC